MKSIKAKLLLTILGIVLLSNSVLTWVAYRISNRELTKSVQGEMDAVASQAATEISETNNGYFKMLSAFTVMPFVTDPSISLEEKNRQLHAIAEANKSYTNIAYYNAEGYSYSGDGRLMNFKDKPYFQEAMKGNIYISDPYISNVDNNLTMVFSRPVYDSSKKVTGAVAIIVSGNMMSDVVSKITIGKADHPSIINMKTGVTVGNVDKNKVRAGENVTNAPTAEMKKLLTRVCTGETGGGTFFDPALKKKMACAYRPVDDRCGWAVFSAAPYSDFFSGISYMLKCLALTFAVTVVGTFIICSLVVAAIVKPLITVKKAITTIASGNADLTNRIQVKSKDEVGQVCEGFNGFVGKLHTIISDVKHSKDVLGGAGDQLERSTEDTASSITQILANIDSVHSQIVNQSASVEETAGAVNEIASNIASLERMIENQSSGVTEASAAVEEMIGNIGSVNQSVEKMAMSFDELQTNAQTGSAKQQDVNERITQIESQSQMLQEANSAIAAIASQTNLLAMNAAIEAAHAGDAGKGFSVVADEIRKLSETSSVQSKTIGEQLQKIQDSINTVVTASGESNEAFLSVSNKIKETDELVRQIKSAMLEQTEGSKQISDALHSMNDSTSEVRTASAEMSAGNKAILEEVKHLQDATMVMKDSMNEMSVGAKKINDTGTALNDISKKMKESIQEIGGQIDQFKV